MISFDESKAHAQSTPKTSKTKIVNTDTDQYFSTQYPNILVLEHVYSQVKIPL